MNSTNARLNDHIPEDADQDYYRGNNMSRNNPRESMNACNDPVSSSNSAYHQHHPQFTAYPNTQNSYNPLLPSSNYQYQQSLAEMPSSSMTSHSINPMILHYMPMSMPYGHYPAQQTLMYYNQYDTNNARGTVDHYPSSSYSNKRKADQDADDDDDDDEDDDFPVAGDETKSTGSKISKSSNIRENSKFQREKRKAFVRSLEYLAKELSESQKTNEQKLEEEFDTLNIVHQTIKMQAISFIGLLFNVEAKDSAHSKKSWPDVLESPAFGGFEVFVPPLPFAYKPPMDLDDRTAMLRLSNASEILSFTAGLRIAFETIARTGTNICDSLLFRMKFGRKSFLLNRNLVSFSVVIESYNAKILGGMADISWKVFGNIAMTQRIDGDRIVKAHIYYNALELHKQLSESFRPHVYRPITLSMYKITGEPNSLIDVAQLIAAIEEDTSSNTILWRVQLQNYLVTGLLGDLTKQALVLRDDQNTCRWIPQSVYLPSKQDPSALESTTISLEDQHGSTLLSPSTDVFIQLFPYLEIPKEEMPDQVEIIPNRLFGVVHRCRRIHSEYLVLYLIFDFLQRLLEMFDRETISEGSTTHEHSGESHYTRSSSSSSVSVHQTENTCSFMYTSSNDNLTNASSPGLNKQSQNHPRMTLSGVPAQSPLQQVFIKAMEVYDTVGQVLIGIEEESDQKLNPHHDDYFSAQIEHEADDGIDPSSTFDATDATADEGKPNKDSNHADRLAEKVNACLREFMSWINTIDRLQWNGQEKNSSETPSSVAVDASRNTALMSIQDGSVALTLIARDLPNQTSATHSTTATQSIHSSTGTNPPSNLSSIEVSAVSTISNELQQFFVQIRELKLISKLLSILSFATSPEDVKNAEGFLYLCWTRHTNPSIQTLLSTVKTLMSQKQYDEALSVTGQMIALDPSFAEGYNKRATIYFGLRRPQECFQDIDTVLRLEPYHYGAYCGKGLMLMKIADFESAIKAFDAAMNINPTLRQGGLSKTLAYCYARVSQQVTARPDLDQTSDGLIVEENLIETKLS